MRSKGRKSYVHPFGGASKRLHPVSLSRPRLDDRRARFDGINRACIAAQNAWLTSVAGDIDVAIEVTAGSSIPQRLHDLGYYLVADGRGQRIIPHAITERFTRNADGTLSPLVEGSTLPIMHRTHAGIVEVQRFRFML